MNLLAIDTSTSYSVLGLQTDSQILDRTTQAGRTHSKEILPNIVSILAEARIGLDELDCIVFGQGPGSFTGLRIAVGVVQGLGYGLGIPVAPVSTLACLAYGEYVRSGARSVFVALSARKEEVYFGAYDLEDGIARLVSPEGVADVNELAPLDTEKDWVLIGDGAQFQTSIEQTCGITFQRTNAESKPQAEDLLTLGLGKLTRGETIAAMEARPEYLRETVAAKSNI